MEHLGEKIRKIRKAHDLTQRQLEDKLEVGNSTVSGWEKMAIPPLDGISKVCEYFEVPLWQFFAPENLIIPKLDPDEAAFMKTFKELPLELQTIMIQMNSQVVAAWNLGKSGK